MAGETTSEPTFDPADHGWELVPDEGFLAHAGPIWRRVDGDPHIIGFLAADRHRNHRGVVQGGMLMTLLDRGLGLQARLVTGGIPQATAQLGVSFLDVMRIGEFAEAAGTVQRKGRSLVFVSGQITVGTRLIATAQGIWKIL